MIRGSMTISYDDGGTDREIATLVDAAVSISTETVAVAAEDVYGFADALPATQNWGATGSYLQKVNGTRDITQQRLEVLALARTLLSVTLTTPYGEAYSGTGWIETFDVVAAQGDAMRGSFALSGTGALTRAGDNTLTSAQGSYSLSGQDADLIATKILTADSGSLTLTGQDADLVFGYVLTAESGSFTLTGQDATFETTRGLVAESGSFALIGQDADLKNSRLTAEQGAFVLSGQDADLVYEDNQPSTGSEVTTLLASDITGKSDGETLVAADWPDTSPASASISISGTLTYRASSGNLGGPAVEFDDSGQLRVQSFGDIEVGDSYVTLFVMRTTAVAAHLDELQRADATNTDIVHYYDFGGADDWQVYNGGSPADIHFAAGDTFFSSFGLLKITNDRTSGSTVVHEGSTLGTGEMTSDQITGFRICVSMDMMVEAFVILKNPSSQDVTDWENYLVNAYGVTA